MRFNCASNPENVPSDRFSAPDKRRRRTVSVSTPTTVASSGLTNPMLASLCISGIPTRTGNPRMWCASSAIPGVFTPVEMGDMVLVDGYVLNYWP